MLLRTAAAHCLMVIALGSAVWSQGLDTGRTEFLSKCAPCHGADGRGTGPLGANFKVKPADLTMIAKRNHGVFSPPAVYQMIDGRKSARSHRSGAEMPIWGCRHLSPPVLRWNAHKRNRATPRVWRRKAHEATTESFIDLPCDPESIIQSRILAIVEYLGQIQEK